MTTKDDKFDYKKALKEIFPETKIFVDVYGYCCWRCGNYYEKEEAVIRRNSGYLCLNCI